MTRLAKLKWRIATVLDRLLPGQCWADIADWPLGNKRNPWSPQRPGCREDLARIGSCYCGKLRTPESCLPTHVGDGQCRTCWVLPGMVHELSCEQVTPEQFRAFIAALGRAR